MVVKKYGNRRLYDTEASNYITLEELAEKIRQGREVQVVDAKTGRDLTQPTLAQIILESRGAAKLLPVSLLVRLIRMGDDALAEFFGTYATWALEVYLRVKQGAQLAGPFNPLGGLQLPGAGAFGQFFGSGPAWPQPDPAPREAVDARSDEVAELRRELEEIKRAVGAQGKRRKRG